MKICYFFSNIHLGEATGQSVVSLSLIKKAKKLGHEVYIVSNYNDQQNIPVTPDIKGVKKFLIKGSSDFKTYLLNSFKIIRHLKKIKPDIIHVQGHLLIPYVYFLNKLTRNKIVCTLPERIDYFNKILMHFVVSSIKNIGLCFVLSIWDKNLLIQLGVPTERILVSRIGLRNQFLIKKEKNQNYKYDIFYYGDASRERGFDILYNLSKRLPNLKFKLLVRWVKDEKENLRELKKLNNVFIDYSYLKESRLRQAILESRLVILPYRWMGMQPPITLLEVMALGKCVLTSALEYTKELIIDNENAVLIDPDASMDKIIERIEFLLNNPKVIKNIGQNAHETISQQYSLSEYNKIFLSYEMIVKNFYEWRMFGGVGGDFVSRREISTLLDLLQAKAGEKILDVGTGSGRFARAIIQETKAEIVGLDPDGKILKEGEELKRIYLSRTQQEKYKTVLGNGQDIKFGDNLFDKVVSFRSLKYYPDPYKGISELCRVLKREGTLVLEITSNKSWESIINPVFSKIFRKRKVLHFWEEEMTNFNPTEVKKYLLKRGVAVISERPLHKIPPRLYSIFNNQYIISLLDLLDKVLLRITPKYLFSKSIILKCKKL